MSAMFEFGNQGLLVNADMNDNSDNHPNPHHDAGIALSFDVYNVGDEPGEARVGMECDGTFIAEWTSPTVAPGQNAAAYESIGRFPAGEHTFLVYVNPGSGNANADHAENRRVID